MLKRVLAVALCMAITAAFMCGCTGRQETEYSKIPEYVFRYADNQNEDYPSVLAANYFAEQVFEKTNGRIKIEIYAQAQLGTEMEALSQVQFGGIDFARVSTGSMAQYCDVFNILLLPYIFKDEEHMLKVLEGDVGDKMKQCMLNQGFVGLACYNTGARNFYSVTEIDSFDDFAGLTIRTQNNKPMQDFVALLGAESYLADYNSVLSMLQTGEIDGAENNIPSYNAAKHANYARFCFVDKHNIVPEIMLMSQISMDLLSDEDKKIISDCAALAQSYEYALWNEREQKAMAELLADGVVFNYPNEEELAKARQLAEPIYEEYYEYYGDIIKEIDNARTE